MTIKERTFISWLQRTQPQIGNPTKYSKVIITLSNHLLKKGISDAVLFDIDSALESEKLKDLYFSNPELDQKNIRGNRMYSRAFDLYIEFLRNNYKTENIVRDIIETSKITDLSETEKENVILSRIGQGKFRKQVIEFWNSCSVTGYTEIPLLTASHIKPWKESNNFEKLDVYNGLLLTPNLDKVFDLGLISFTNEGKIVISYIFENFEDLGISKEMKINFVAQHIPYIEYHRKEVFKTK